MQRRAQRVQKRAAAGFDIAPCGVKIAGVPRVGDVAHRTGIFHQQPELSVRVAAADAPHGRKVAAVHTDEQIIRAIVGPRHLPCPVIVKRHAMRPQLPLRSYLGIDAGQLAEVPPYVRALAFDERGQTLLRQAKKRGEICLVNTGQRPPDLPYYAMECRAADLYTLFGAPGTCCCAGMEQKYRIFRKKK